MPALALLNITNLQPRDLEPSQRPSDRVQHLVAVRRSIRDEVRQVVDVRETRVHVDNCQFTCRQVKSFDHL